LLSKVVLPLPRNPVITETGKRDADLSVSNNPMLDSLGSVMDWKRHPGLDHSRRHISVMYLSCER
jgi:hypothetical protein